MVCLILLYWFGIKISGLRLQISVLFSINESGLAFGPGSRKNIKSSFYTLMFLHLPIFTPKFNTINKYLSSAFSERLKLDNHLIFQNGCWQNGAFALLEWKVDQSSWLLMCVSRLDLRGKWKKQQLFMF